MLYIPTLDEEFMTDAYNISRKSKDTRTKIGAVIIPKDDDTPSRNGYNGMPRKVRDDILERYERPEKYSWFEHAERNAIYSCARMGYATNGARMFTQGIPCADCARGIIQAGIVEVIVHKQWMDLEKTVRKHDKWEESAKRSLQMFEESGVKLRLFDKVLGVQTLMDGQIVNV